MDYLNDEIKLKTGVIIGSGIGWLETIQDTTVNLYKNGILPHIQIHDELCVSIPNKETALQVKSIMENAIRLRIPNKVDYASGDNWGNIK